MISLVAAVAENGVIGSKNALPWYLPEDLKHFKELTIGKTVLMGRKTYDSILTKLGGPLPERKNIVITRNSNLDVAEGVLVYSNIGKALDDLKKEVELVIIGGGEVYKQTINFADRLYITEVHKIVAGDVEFPEIKSTEWQEISRVDHEGYSFVTYERNK